LLLSAVLQRCCCSVPRLLHGARSAARLLQAHRAAIDQQQTRRTPLLLSIDGTDIRTDGRSTVS